MLVLVLYPPVRQGDKNISPAHNHFPTLLPSPMLMAALGAGVLVSCVGCSTANYDGTTSSPASESIITTLSRPAPDSSHKPQLEGLIISNLSTEQAQSETRQALLAAGIEPQPVERFFAGVDLYNQAVPAPALIADALPGQSASSHSPGGILDYDAAELSAHFSARYPDFPGTNCRLSTFGLISSAVKISANKAADSSLLFLDDAALRSAPTSLKQTQSLVGGKEEEFHTLYARIPTTTAKDPAQHSKDIQAYFSAHHVDFSALGSAHVLSVFMHDTIEEQAYLFIGHTGLAVPTAAGGLLFIEKLAFDLPYQTVKVKNMQQLGDYLMAYYDDGPDLEYGQPLIFDGTQPLAGMRYKDGSRPSLD